MPEDEKRAVIIGIKDYNDTRINKLNGAEYDAREIHERLTDPKIGNFKVSEEHYLIGPDATCERIRKAIGEVFCKKEKRDMALFYFSGHGFDDSYGDGYIAPCDISVDNPFVCGINMRELKQVICRSHDSMTHNKCVIMILDSCYSGIVTENDKAMLSPVSKTKYGEHIKDLSEGIIILASSGADEKSREVKFPHENEQESHPHGAFTYHLIEGLDGKASDDNGIIYLNSLRDYIDNHLIDEGRQKSTSFEAGASGISNIRFAYAPAIHKDILYKNLKDANELNSQQDLASLITAIEIINRILNNISPKNSEAIELKNKISETLTKYRESIGYYLSYCEQDIRPSLPNVFPRFDDLAKYMNIDDIASRDRTDKALLIALCNVSRDYSDFCAKEPDDLEKLKNINKEFITKCKPFDNPSSRPKFTVPISKPR